MKTHSEKFLRQRKFYMVLPLLVLPFITMIFWALGGGKGGEVQAQQVKSGLNMELPGVHFNKGEELWDKFTLYEQAKRDSLKMEEAKRNDPYYVMTSLEGYDPYDTVREEKNKLNTSLGSKDKYSQIDKDEKEITKKLELLTKQLAAEENKPASSASSSFKTISAVQPSPESMVSPEVQQLEAMMQQMNTDSSADPEMQQMDGMLEKILDIQHPERVKEKLRQQSSLHQQHVYEVKAFAEQDNISLVEAKDVRTGSNDTIAIESRLSMTSQTDIGFFGLSDETPVESEASNAIEAVVHNEQTVVAGSTIKLRLLSDVYIKGELIEKDQFLFGTCSISGERLIVQINSIREEHSLFPVALEVYDMDGLPGIYIPGAISRDVGKQAASQSIQDIQMNSFSNSLEVQAASAGIEAAKGIFTKKVKLIKVTVKAGYQILLKDKNQSST